MKNNMATSGLHLYDPQALLKVYAITGSLPLWFDLEGELRPVAGHLYNILNQAELVGLQPDDYHRQQLARLLESPSDLSAGGSIDLELLLSDAALLYATHLQNGKVDPESLDPKWQISEELTKLLPEHTSSVETLENWYVSLESKQPTYRRIKLELARLRQFYKPDFYVLSRSLKTGDSDAEVLNLRILLERLGYPVKEQSSEVFTVGVQDALVKFQQQSGLVEDGVLGPATRQAIHQAYHGNLDKLRVNLERWRWMPHEFEPEYISVNIASFNLSYVEADDVLLQMKTIVGRTYRKTPVFSDRLRYFVLNPSWSVPTSIAIKDILPKIKTNPNYLSEMNMLVLQGWGAQQKIIAPQDVDWQSLSQDSFPYHLRQLPGQNNALGRVKFMFPNEHNVYLHDTNDPTLFTQFSRAFSSGCIRLEKPLELLELITVRHTALSRDKVNELLDSGKETTVLLTKPLPIHIQYWTVWVDDDDVVHYRHDIYERDRAILKALTSEHHQ
jgi:L,D-transpeptidase YcbB